MIGMITIMTINDDNDNDDVAIAIATTVITTAMAIMIFLNTLQFLQGDNRTFC